MKKQTATKKATTVKTAPASVPASALVPKVDYNHVTLKNAVNEPKVSAIAADITALHGILGNGTDKLSPFGHKKVSDSGKMDMAFLSGITTMSGLSAVCGTSKTSKRTKDSQRACDLRPKNHFGWMADTAGHNSGVVKRLENVYGKEAKHIGKQIAPYLRRIADAINAAFAATYGRKATAKK